MQQVFKKVLANILVLMVITLPLRAMAMPIDMSADHCNGMNTEMSGDMSSMHHEGHQMPATMDDEKQASNCQCCDQCTGDCTDCASMSAVGFEPLQFTDAKTHEIFTVIADLLFTHITSPPSRPPQTIHI